MNSSIFQSPSSTSQFQTTLNDRAVSPSRAKISQLSEKLSNMQGQINEDRTLKRDQFEGKLKQLEEKVTKQVQNDEAKFKLLKDQLAKIQDELQNEIIIRDNSEQNFRLKDLKGIESYLQKEILKDRQTRKESDNRILKLVDERIYQTRLELTRQKKAREELEEQSAQEYGERILGLQEEVEAERRSREEQNQIIISNFGDQILSLQETLTKERRQREEAQSIMFKMLDEMGNYLNRQLQDEKIQREATEETLLGLLDETCNRVGNQLRR